MLRTKIVVPVLFITVLLILVVVLFYKTQDVRTLNQRWKLDLPLSTNDEKSVDGVGWFGEGYNYYLIYPEDSDIKDHEIFDVTDHKLPDYDITEKYLEIIEDENITEAIDIDWSSEYVWTELNENGRTLYVIAFDNYTKLILIEIIE